MATHGSHKGKRHTQAALNPSAWRNAWSVGPSVFRPHVGEPGASRQGVFVATGSRGDISGTAGLRAAGGPSTPGLGRPSECTLGQGTAPVGPGVKGAHSALGEPPPEGGKASRGGLRRAWARSTQPEPLWPWSLLLGTSREFFYAEVWKRLSLLPRDLAALPDLLSSTHPTLKSTSLK